MSADFVARGMARQIASTSAASASALASSAAGQGAALIAIGSAVGTNLTVQDAINLAGPRTAANCARAAAFAAGSTLAIGGLVYLVDPTKTGTASCTNDLGIAGLVPSGVPRPQHFGAKADGVADDTAAVQAWVNFITVAGLSGFVPAGTYRLTAAIAFPNRPNWRIRGAGQRVSVFKMATDNTHIFDIGMVAGSASFMFAIEDIGFDYVNPQTGQTNAYAICYNSMPYHVSLRRLSFEKGYYGIGCAATIAGVPWATSYDELHFGSGLTGGAIDYSNTTGAGPNNHWGRLSIEATAMAGPIFKQLKGYSSQIGAVEIFNGGTNCQWIDFQAGAEWNIGVIKHELPSYTGTLAFNGSALIYAPSAVVRIGQVFIGGTTAVFNTANALYLIGGAARSVQIDYIEAACTTGPTNFYLSNVGSGRVSIGRYYCPSGTPVPFTNLGSSAAADSLVYEWGAQRRLSADIGNADYTRATNGGPNVIVAQTALTASHTVEIQPDGNCAFNGETIEVLSRGAVNGSNTLVVKAGGTTKATLTADNTKVVLVWRRYPTASGGWVVTYQGAA